MFENPCDMARTKKVPRKSTGGRTSDKFHGLASIIANINGEPRQLRWNAKFEFIE